MGWRKFGAPGRRTDHVQMWAVGQATAIERSLALFQTRRGTEGIFPEFTFLDCHSCHRRIFDQAKPVRTGLDNPGRNLPEGMPPYNDENLIMRSEEHTSELQSLMRISYAVFCLKKKKND